MIDGLFKRYIDPLWEKAAAPLVRARLTPNQVTGIGVALVAASCAAYALHQSQLVFGLSLIFCFVFDALDGAVARQRDMRSRVGGYFDAMADRYQELAVFFVIAMVDGYGALCLLAFSGGVMTSYAKARTALEIRTDNDSWPDFFERLERIIFLIALLILSGLFGAYEPRILPAGLALYALLAHATAVQRIRRAVRRLQDADRSGRE
ncbi:MAG: CDP-alcohol phosphatidyltransferase family protein [Mesorhizobium sp.]